MKQLTNIETHEYQLVVIECDCGFHVGLDATYLIQVEDIVFPCPACGKKIDSLVTYPPHNPPQRKGAE